MNIGGRFKGIVLKFLLFAFCWLFVITVNWVYVLFAIRPAEKAVVDLIRCVVIFKEKPADKTKVVNDSNSPFT